MKRRIFTTFMVLVLVLVTSLSASTKPVRATSFHDAGSQYETVPGELIVCVEKTDTMQLQTAEKTSSSLVDLLNSDVFTVKDDLFESSGINQQYYTAEEKNLKNEAVENMGYTYLVEYPKEKLSFQTASEKVSAALKGAGYQVKSIEPNYILEAIGLSDTSEYSLQSVQAQAVNPSQQWQYDMIKATSAWNITTGSSNVRMAVLDTGIDNTHPSLANFVNTSLGKNYAGGADTMDRQGHGTHVAGTIASYGSVSGVMQNATLIPVKVLGDDGKGTMYGIEQGILYAASISADVINMSLGGGGYSDSFAAACNTATSGGVIIVAASGNDSTTYISYPARYDNVIAVGAVDSGRRRASFSNYGPGLDVMAPGVSVYSTSPGGRYVTMSGTSMACPHVAGVVGLLRSYDKSLTYAQVDSLLKSTAQPAGSTTEYGAGIVDVYAALQQLSGTSPITQVAAPAFSLPAGTYKGQQKVSLSCTTAGATIRYTINGQEPAETSPVYTEALTISATTTVKAKAFEAGMTASQTVTATYTIESTNPDNPSAAPWQAGKAYLIGDVVSYDGKTYVCRQSHTSLLGWEPSNVPALWLLKENSTAIVKW